MRAAGDTRIERGFFADPVPAVSESCLTGASSVDDRSVVGLLRSFGALLVDGLVSFIPCFPDRAFRVLPVAEEVYFVLGLSELAFKTAFLRMISESESGDGGGGRGMVTWV